MKSCILQSEWVREVGGVASFYEIRSGLSGQVELVFDLVAISKEVRTKLTQTCVALRRVHFHVPPLCSRELYVLERHFDVSEIKKILIRNETDDRPVI